MRVDRADMSSSLAAMSGLQRCLDITTCLLCITDCNLEMSFNLYDLLANVCSTF